MRKAKGVPTPKVSDVQAGADRQKLISVEIEPGRILVCDPMGPIHHGTHVVVTTWDGRQLEGRITTPYPEKTTTLNIQLALGGTLKKVRKASVASVVSEFSSA